MTWAENHVPGPSARLLVAMVDVSAGPKVGRVLTSQLITAPGAKPVPFQLTYQRSELVDGAKYSVVAALIDGDLGWLNETGVAVPVTDPAVTGIVVPLTYRPDLLKAAVSGTVTGAGLDGSGSPNSYTSVVIVNPASGQIIGFAAIAPFGAAPVAFTVPYSLTDVSPSATYVLNATAWDGTVFWTGDGQTRVITGGSPSTGVTVPLTAGPAPTPPPTSAPIVPEASFAPLPDYANSGGFGIGWFLVLLAAVTVAAFLITWAWIGIRGNRRRG